jgi:hypothetical protein
MEEMESVDINGQVDDKMDGQVPKHDLVGTILAHCLKSRKDTTVEEALVETDQTIVEGIVHPDLTLVEDIVHDQRGDSVVDRVETVAEPFLEKFHRENATGEPAVEDVVMQGNEDTLSSTCEDGGAIINCNDVQRHMFKSDNWSKIVYAECERSYRMAQKSIKVTFQEKIEEAKIRAKKSRSELDEENERNDNRGLGEWSRALKKLKNRYINDKKKANLLIDCLENTLFHPLEDIYGIRSDRRQYILCVQQKNRSILQKKLDLTDGETTVNRNAIKLADSEAIIEKGKFVVRRTNEKKLSTLHRKEITPSTISDLEPLNSRRKESSDSKLIMWIKCVAKFQRKEELNSYTFEGWSVCCREDIYRYVDEPALMEHITSSVVMDLKRHFLTIFNIEYSTKKRCQLH